MKAAVVSVLLIGLFLLGCGEEEKEITPEAGGYTGFMAMKGGEWAEYLYEAGGQSVRQRMEFIGSDTFDSKECNVIEIEVGDGVKMVYQIWIDKGTGDMVVAAMKQGDLVLRIDPSVLPEKSGDLSRGSVSTPPEYKPGLETSSQTYQTPTGKTVEAVVFTSEEGEVWVSGDVPFGIVKIVSDGSTVMSLYDFDLSGAKRDITKEEVENAISLPGIGG